MNVYITWQSGKTTKSRKNYRTRKSAENAVKWIVENFPHEYRVIEIA